MAVLVVSLASAILSASCRAAVESGLSCSPARDCGQNPSSANRLRFEDSGCVTVYRFRGFMGLWQRVNQDCSQDHVRASGDPTRSVQTCEACQNKTHANSEDPEQN